jgi:hypothetical protein
LKAVRSPESIGLGDGESDQLSHGRDVEVAGVDQFLPGEVLCKRLLFVVTLRKREPVDGASEPGNGLSSRSVAHRGTRPASLDDLSKVSGVGQSKLKRYGADVLEVVRAN